MVTRCPFSDGILLMCASRRLRTISLLSVLALAGAARAFAAENEPLYYIYQGQPKQLTLDSEHVAVHVRTTSPDQFPAGLISRGFTPADVEARPLGDWMILRDSALAGRSTQNVHAGGMNLIRTDAVAVHDRLRALGTTGDAAVDFASPVFRDDHGNPMLITSRLLIGFNKDIPLATRSELQASIGAGAEVEYAMFPQPDDVRWQIRTNDGFAVLATANALAHT